jgi:hypothetical protein
MKASGHDKAIAAMIKWARRDEWRDRLDAVIADHLEPVCAEFAVDLNDLPEILGPDAYTQLFACVFEDFLTCDFEPAEQNIIEDYLQRRGWKDPVPVKHYLQALRGSIMSLYEVVGSEPGSHFLAQDLIRGGEPLRIDDKLGSQSVGQWDRLAARMLPIGTKTEMAGGVLLLSFDDAGAILEEISALKVDFSRRLSRRAKRAGVLPGVLEGPPVDDAVLGEMAPLFTRTWLATALRQIQGRATPKLVNSDGEGIVFSETRFPIADRVRSAAIENRLDGLAELVRDEADQLAWTWLSDAPPSGSLPAGPRKAIMLKTYDERGGQVLGSVRLDPAAVVLQTNSAERAERGRTLLSEALGSLVGSPLTAMQTAEQAMAEQAAKGPVDASREPPLPPEELAAVLHDTLDRHYRDVISQPLPILGGKSPRQAVRSKTGRQQVAQWLKGMENSTARLTKRQGIPPYDSSWMWEALKITDLRR